MKRDIIAAVLMLIAVSLCVAGAIVVKPIVMCFGAIAASVAVVIRLAASRASRR